MTNTNLKITVELTLHSESFEDGVFIAKELSNRKDVKFATAKKIETKIEYR